MHLPTLFMALSSSLRDIARVGLLAGLVIVVIFAVLPPLLRWGLGKRLVPPGREYWRRRVLRRYQNVSTYHWLFAIGKLRHDSMSTELPEFLAAAGPVRAALDIGCGYGVPSCLILEWFPEARVFGIDPNAARVRVAAAAFGDRGEALQAAAPDIATPGQPECFDAVLALDVIHYLSDDELAQTLATIRGRLAEGGRLYLRAVVVRPQRSPVLSVVKTAWHRFVGAHGRKRSAEQVREMIESAGLKVEKWKVAECSRELVWFVAGAPAPSLLPPQQVDHNSDRH
jgi:uncharacterized protein